MFRDEFKEPGESFTFESKKDGVMTEEDALEKIKKSKLKVKEIIPSKFGTEIIFFNSKDAKEAGKLVGADDIDGHSILVK